MLGRLRDLLHYYHTLLVTIYLLYYCIQSYYYLVIKSVFIYIIPFSRPYTIQIGVRCVPYLYPAES